MQIEMYETRNVHHTHEVESTWLGRRARCLTEYEHATEDLPRWVTMTWIDDADPRNGGHPAGTITRSRVTGNWRKKTLEVLVPEQVVGSVPIQ